jgi:hypothetical protein
MTTRAAIPECVRARVELEVLGYGADDADGLDQRGVTP